MPDDLLQFEPTVESTEAPDLGSTSVETGGTSPALETPAQTVQPEPQQLGIRELASQLGYSFDPSIDNEYSALAHLTSQARRAQELEAIQRQQDVYAQLGRQLAPQAPQISQYLQQQQAPPGPKPYEPPPFDKRWLPLVERDAATGVLIGKPGANVPPAIVDAANKYSDWLSEFQTNPMSILKPALEEAENRAYERAKAEIAQSRAQYETQTAVQQIVARNSSWFYAATGQPTDLGREYIGIVQALQQRGVTDPRYKDEIATSILAPKIAAAQSAGTVQQTAQQRQAAAAKTQTRNRNPLQALAVHQGDQTPGYVPPDQQGLGLADRLRKAFKENGVSDDEILLSAV